MSEEEMGLAMADAVWREGHRSKMPPVAPVKNFELTPQQSLVYEAMTDDMMTTTQIAKSAGLSSQNVMVVLNAMRAKGAVDRLPRKRGAVAYWWRA